jgi:hypothetical protein
MIAAALVANTITFYRAGSVLTLLLGHYHRASDLDKNLCSKHAQTMGETLRAIAGGWMAFVKHAENLSLDFRESSASKTG